MEQLKRQKYEPGKKRAEYGAKTHGLWNALAAIKIGHFMYPKKFGLSVHRISLQPAVKTLAGLKVYRKFILYSLHLMWIEFFSRSKKRSHKFTRLPWVYPRDPLFTVRSGFFDCSALSSEVRVRLHSSRDWLIFQVKKNKQHNVPICERKFRCELAISVPDYIFHCDVSILSNVCFN